MQLDIIKISNILSFPYLNDIEKNPGIRFHSKEKGSMNILIGPNGSGKSNFLEIINQIMRRGLIKDFVYNQQLIDSPTPDLTQVIKENTVQVHNLEKHFSYQNKPSHVHADIVIGNNDFDNMEFIQKFRTEVNSIIKKYSSLNVEFPIIELEKMAKDTTLHIEFEVDFTNHAVRIINAENLSEPQQFILQYLQYTELIQTCMHIYNDYEKAEDTRRRYPLKNTFAVLGSYRNFQQTVESKKNLTPQERNTYISSQSTRSNFGMAFGYYLCTLKLRDLLYKIRKECLEANPNLQCSYESLYVQLKETAFFKSLNEMIYEYLEVKLELSFVDGDFYFLIRDSRDQVYHFHELSAGEQSFLMIILTCHGFDLENGFMVIDEPELHLHPQMQKKCMDFIKSMSEKLQIQCIIATHSPLMINEENIYHVYRFAKHDMNSVIFSPSYSITGDEATLVHMLKFGNVAKIFFVQKIIMVEGETDAYFFDYLLEHYIHSKECPRNKSIRNYEIININGKGSYTKWRHFLSKFGLEAYFIGDRDNVIEKGLVPNIRKVENYAKKQNRKSHKPYYKTSRYENIVHGLKSYSPEEYKQMIENIEKMYEKGLFILKQGDLEAYLGLHSKGLDDTISFCNNEFTQWIHDSRFATKREELENIFERIFSK